MVIPRLRDDVSTISYDLFKRSTLAVKFKVKTSYLSKNNEEIYYHNEYVFNQNGKKRTTLSLAPRPYIQIEILGEENNKNIVYFPEAFKNRFVRKFTKLVALLEAYDSREIDIITIDSTGTHINNKFPKSESVIMGKSSIYIETCIREDKSDIGVFIKFDDYPGTVISLCDFLDLYYKLKDINYTSFAMMLLTYFGSPELGQHETDFRDTVYVDDTSIPMTSSYYDPMKEFDSIKEIDTTRTNNKRIKW